MPSEYIDEPVVLELKKADALVLFEWLERSADKGAELSSDTAEGAALAHLTGALERTLVEPFWPNYAQVLEEARRRITE